MAWTKPGEFGGGATSGTIVTFVTQPIRAYWGRSPRQGTRDNGVVQHGRDTLFLVMATDDIPITMDEAVEFFALYNTAKTQRSRIWLTYWDQELASGAGDYADARFIMEPIDSDLADADGNHYRMTLVFRARGIPA